MYFHLCIFCLHFTCLDSSIHKTLVVPAGVAVVVVVVWEQPVAVREYSSGLHWSSLPPPMGRSSCAPSAMVGGNALHLT